MCACAPVYIYNSRCAQEIRYLQQVLACAEPAFSLAQPSWGLVWVFLEHSCPQCSSWPRAPCWLCFSHVRCHPFHLLRLLLQQHWFGAASRKFFHVVSCCIHTAAALLLLLHFTRFAISAVWLLNLSYFCCCNTLLKMPC